MNEKQILTEFYQLRPDIDRRANDSFLIEKAKKPLTFESLSVAAIQLETTLLLTPYFQSAWDEFVFYNPEKKGTAFRREFLDAMREKEILSAELREYDSLIEELGREDLRGLPLQDLREIAATNRENKRRKSLNRSELSALALAERPVPQPAELPQFYVPIGKKREVELTAQVLRDAGKRNAALSLADLKFLVNRYGSKVNDRLGVTPTIQPGYTQSVKL